MTQMEQFIREYAASIGLNPDVVMRTVLSEGGRQSLEPAGYARQSIVGGTGAGQEQSYGPFQMYLGKGALGDRALQAGYNPRDPKQAFNVAKFAMDTMKKEGLGAWHGWKGDPWAAHGGKPSGAQVDVPSGAEARYDPRSDTPSSGRPTGSELPGPPSQYSLPAGGYNPPSESGGRFGGSGLGEPGLSRKDLLDALGGKQKTPMQAMGESLIGSGVGGGKPFSYDVPPVTPVGLSQAQPTSMTNPQAADSKRQMLAYLMQRLNQGGLV